MIKAVIFDLDGVIVSTDELHYQAWKMIADQEHIEFNHRINHRLRGVSRMDSLNIILEKANKTYSDTEKLDMATRKNNYYVELLKSLSEKDVLPGVVEVLHALHQQGIKTAIGSSSRNTKAILKYIGLEKSFDVIADGNDIKNSKPAPDVFLKAAEKLDMHPSSCVVVEDALAGIEAAKRAGMIAVAMSDAKNSHLADYRFNSILDLLSLF